MERALKWVAIPGAIAAFLTVLAYLPLDRPAWSSDIRRLDRGQANYAVDVYSKAIRDDTILKEQVKEQSTKALIDERITDYQSKLRAARDRAIELGK